MVSKKIFKLFFLIISWKEGISVDYSVDIRHSIAAFNMS